MNEDLTQLQLDQKKKGMKKVMEARKNGRWANYRDGKIIVAEKWNS